MKNDLSCGVVKDLLPGYIENLMSEETNRAVEAHLAECDSCRAVLAAMRGGDGAIIPDAAEEKEIDYLKKLHRAEKKRLLAGVLAVALLLCAGFWFKIYRYGSNVDASAVHVVNITREDGGFSIGGNLKDKSLGVTHAALQIVDDGVAEFRLRAAKKNGMDNDFLVGWESDVYENVREIRMGERILWYEGLQIDEIVSDVYNARHAYIGDAPANGALASALRISDTFGAFTMEVVTDEEPYGWRICLHHPVSHRGKTIATDYPESLLQMRGFAVVMIACVDNLDWVEFEYVMDGKEGVFRMDEAEASETIASGPSGSIKDCSIKPSALQALMEMLGF